MSKLKEIKKELKTMGREKAIFNTYDSKNMRKSKCLEINALDIIEQLETNKENKLIDTFKEFGYTDFEDVLECCNYEEIEHGNTYNINLPVIINYRIFKYLDKYYTALRFHKYGDVRGNYTDYATFRIPDSYFEWLFYELDQVRKSVEIEVNKKLYYIESTASQDGLRIECNEDYETIAEDAYLDCYPDDKKIEIKKALKEYLKEINPI